MAEFKNAGVGTIALIQQQSDGSIAQIGTTQAQSDMIQLFLAKLSEENALVKMPEQYDLVPKSQVCENCKSLKIT